MGINKVAILLIMFFLPGCKGTRQENTGSATTLPIANQAGTDAVYFEAALNGDNTIVHQFIASGTDVNSSDNEGRTALMLASFNGHMEIVQDLIEKGANINQVDINNRSALMMASSGPFPETVLVLLQHEADPNLTDLPEHFTALMYAASEGQLEVVKVLLEHNADPLLKDIDGDNAVTFASKNGHTEVAEYLSAYSSSK